MNNSSGQTDSVILKHNLNPKKFKWLWMKYVRGANDKYHCTNSIRGFYGKKLNKANKELASTPKLILDEQPINSFSAIYICGVASKGYQKKENYPHNLHTVISPEPGKVDVFDFEDWHLEVENGRFIAIPEETDLPEKYKTLSDKYVTCRIFRWAVVTFCEELGQDND